MPDNQIASGSVVLTANADQMTTRLNKAGQEIQQWGSSNAVQARAGAQKIGKEVEESFEHTQKKLNKAFRKFAHHEGGFLGVLGEGVAEDLGLASTGAVVAGVIIGVTQLRNLMMELSGYGEDFAHALERAQQLNARGQAGLDKRLADLNEELAGLSNDPSEEIGRIETKLKGLRTEFQGTANNANRLRKELEGLNEFSVENLKDRIHLAHGDKIKELTDQLHNADAGTDKFRSTIEKLEVELRKLRQGSIDLALSGEIKKAAEEYEKLSRQINMTQGEKALDDFRTRESKALRAGGKNQADELEKLQEKIKANEFNQSYTEQQKSYDELKQRLQDASDLMGRTAEEIAVIRLERDAAKLADQGKAGISDKQSRELRALLPERLPPWLGTAVQLAGMAGQVVRDAAKLPNVGGALEFGGKDAYSLTVQNKLAGLGLGKGLEDVNKENGKKLDAVKSAIEAMSDKIVRQFENIGVI